MNLLKTGGEEKESLVIADLSREQPVTVNVNWLNVERITKFRGLCNLSNAHVIVLPWSD
jgi:hypothetical protein